MATATVRPLTTRTRVALAIARAVAAARGDSDLTPAHIALGILREGANPALAVLYHLGTTPDIFNRLRAAVEASLGDPPGRTQPRQVALDLTPGEEAAVSLADVEAEALNDGYVGTEHLLLALLRDPASDPVVLLRDQGITPEIFAGGIRSLRSGDTSQ